MLPSRLTVALAAAPLLLGLIASLDPALVWPMLAADLALLLVLGLDALLVRNERIEVERDCGTGVFSIGRTNPIRLRIRSHVRRTIRLDITDDTFEPAQVEGLPRTLTLPARGYEHIEYRIIPGRRGAYRLGDHWVRHRSPLGLWLRRVRIPATDEIRVYPDVQEVRAFDLATAKSRDAGLRAARRTRGGRSEFECLREYTRDDEYRSVDWRATARHRKLIARHYQIERDQTIVFALDCGRLMTAPSQGLPLFDHALNAALMLSHVSIRNGDQAGLLAFSDRVQRFVAPGKGAAMVRRLLQSTFDLHPTATFTDFEGAFVRSDAALRKRSLVVLITQIVDPTGAQSLLRTVRGLSRRHLPLCVVLRDPTLEAMVAPRRPSDAALYRAAAASELLQERARLLRDLRQAGALILDVAPAELTPALVARYVEIKTAHLL